MNSGWLVLNTRALWVFLVFGIGSLVASCLMLYAWFRRSGMTET